MKHIIKHLTRPTDTMRTFKVSEPLSRYNYHGTLDLFSGHAPNLVCLDLPDEMSIVFPHKSPLIFNSNMRDLGLGLFTTSPSEIFDACQSMPLLEKIALRIAGSEYWEHEAPALVDPPSLAKLKMAHLREIFIYTEDGNMDIYAGFLERITPSPGCQLAMRHGIYTEEDYLLQYARPMGQVFKQFASSLHAVRNAQKPTPYPCFKASSSDFEFCFYNGKLSLEFMLHDQNGPPIPIPLISRLLRLCGQFEILGEIDTFAFDINRMGPDIVTEEINEEFHSNLQQMMQSLKRVTRFRTSKVNMGLLAPYFSDRTILPSLKHIDI